MRALWALAGVVLLYISGCGYRYTYVERGRYLGSEQRMVNVETTEDLRVTTAKDRIVLIRIRVTKQQVHPFYSYLPAVGADKGTKMGFGGFIGDTLGVIFTPATLGLNHVMLKFIDASRVQFRPGTVVELQRGGYAVVPSTGHFGRNVGMAMIPGMAGWKAPGSCMLTKAGRSLVTSRAKELSKKRIRELDVFRDLPELDLRHFSCKEELTVLEGGDPIVIPGRPMMLSASNLTTQLLVHTVEVSINGQVIAPNRYRSTADGVVIPMSELSGSGGHTIAVQMEGPDYSLRRSFRYTEDAQ